MIFQHWFHGSQWLKSQALRKGRFLGATCHQILVQSCPTEALEGPQERNPENNTATSLWLRRKPSLNPCTGSQAPVALGYGYQGSPRGRVDGEVRPPIWPRFWPCPRLSMSSRPPTCHGTSAAVGPAGPTVLWDVLVPGDAGIVDTVHVSPVPVLGEISWGQVFMRPRIGPGKRSWQWKTIHTWGLPSRNQGHRSSHSSCGPLPFPKMCKFQSLTQKKHQQNNPGLLEANCDRSSPKYPSAHQQRQERRGLPKPANPKPPRM